MGFIANERTWLFALAFLALLVFLTFLFKGRLFGKGLIECPVLVLPGFEDTDRFLTDLIGKLPESDRLFITGMKYFVPGWFGFGFGLICTNRHCIFAGEELKKHFCKKQSVPKSVLKQYRSEYLDSASRLICLLQEKLCREASPEQLGSAANFYMDWKAQGRNINLKEALKHEFSHIDSLDQNCVALKKGEILRALVLLERVLDGEENYSNLKGGLAKFRIAAEAGDYPDMRDSSPLLDYFEWEEFSFVKDRDPFPSLYALREALDNYRVYLSYGISNEAQILSRHEAKR